MAVENAAAVIGKSVQIRGEVKGSEDLVVDGLVEGTITLAENRLTIGPHATVTANVAARDVVIQGRLNGDIKASGRVELRAGCDLIGDIVTLRISIEENAMFRGKVELAQPIEKSAGAAEKAGNPQAKAGSPEAPLFNATSPKAG
jgi:cytoskeletal protein CcmA (bactofilin family)